MGLIERLFGVAFGSGINVVRETAEVFRENAEASGMRAAQARRDALAQFGAEFAVAREGWFDRFMDALNRVPRPAMALGTVALFGAAMFNPVWFAERMQGMALVPEPLWWLMGAIVSFYFGARHQAKGQEFQRQVAASVARVPQVMDNLEVLRKLRADSPGAAQCDIAVQSISDNAALDEWRSQM